MVNYTNELEAQKPILVALGQQQAIFNQIIPLVDSAGVSFSRFIGCQEHQTHPRFFQPFSVLVGDLTAGYETTVYEQDNTDIFESLIASLLRIYGSSVPD